MDNRNDKFKNLKFPFCINTQEEKEEYIYYNQCIEYLDDFSLTRPEKCTSHEFKIIKKAVNTLSPLNKPHKLAEFLKTDVDLIYYGMEHGYIEFFKTRNRCSIKTASIIKFLKKFSSLVKNLEID